MLTDLPNLSVRRNTVATRTPAEIAEIARETAARKARRIENALAEGRAETRRQRAERVTYRALAR